MFNTTIHHKEYIPYTKNVEVNEHRAPTDESIKLFDEIQQRTINRVVNSFEIKDNTINAVVVYFVHSIQIDKLEFVCKFYFNGKGHQFNGEILRHELINSKYGSNAVAIELGKRLCYLFADNVLKEVPDLHKYLNSNLW
ncbi:MAG: hypothetical protein KA807_16325 [Prolixibacteraceae bacterium]|nr:hypothetical protein [Prolixibacteraceae bacterium]